MEMKRDAAELLYFEHRYILKVVDVLKATADELQAGRAVDPGDLRKSIAFMRDFADHCHHAKEEKILFPLMREKGVPDTGCPIGALLHEHVRARELMSLLSAAVDRYEAEGIGDATAKIVSVIQEIGELYASHIWKEDNMVFPMIERLFSPEERESLYVAFQDAEAEVGLTHEALSETALRLEERAQPQGE